jgi:hypothetical protein
LNGVDGPTGDALDPVQQGEVVPLEGTLSEDSSGNSVDGEAEAISARASEARAKRGGEELGVNEAAAESGGGSMGGGVAWTMTGLAAAITLGALSLGAVLWQRRRA